MPDDDDIKVLVVDDEQDVADTYAMRILRYETDVAYGGKEALEKIDADTDVVLLDRRMPEKSGYKVLFEIRDRPNLDCRVIMLTAIDADYDILNMPFDDYLNKPVERDELATVIDRQLKLRDYDDEVSEYAELKRKIEVLRAEKPADEFERNEEVQKLQTRASELEAALDESVPGFAELA